MERSNDVLRREARLRAELADARRLAARLQEVIEASREIVGSHSVAYVAESSAVALARSALAASALVWSLDGDVPRCVGDSACPHGHELDPDRTATPGPVVRGALATGVVGREGATVALPLLVGIRVVGAVELRDCGLDDPAADGALAALVAQVGTALESARLYAATDELARLDPLTRLPNRRSLDADLVTELHRVERYERPMSFLLLDLDHFKAVNDTCGHLVGDRVLQHVADVLRVGLRASDTVYRLGGEELAVIARETAEAGARELAERLRRSIDASAELRDDVADRVAVTASIGVVTVTGGSVLPAELVAAADTALYLAKRRGRNRVAVAPPPGTAAREVG